MLQALFSREPENTRNHNIAKGLREPKAGLGSSVRHQVYTELLNCSIISKPFAWSLSKRSLQSGEALEIVQMGSRALRRKNTFWGSPGDHGRLHCGWALKKVSSPHSGGLYHSYNQEGRPCPRLRTHSGCWWMGYLPRREPLLPQEATFHVSFFSGNWRGAGFRPVFGDDG